MRFCAARHRLLALFVCACAGLTGAAPARAIEPPASVYEQPARIVVVANILGEYHLFTRTLRNAEVVGPGDNWIAGDAHLVILGNFIGYGEGVRRVIDKIRSLERQASEAHGMVHVLLGVNEIDLLHRDISFINPSVYSDLASEDSDEKIKEMTERGVQEMVTRAPGGLSPGAARREYENFAQREFKPGSVEFLELFAPGTELGDWFRSRNVVIRIGDYLFSPGGLSLRYAQKPLDQINSEERALLAKDTLLLRGDTIITHPVWWRYLVTRPVSEMQPIVDATLYITNARAQIVGLTQNARPTHQGFNARVFFVDSGMQAFQIGAVNRRLSALDIVGDEFTIILDEKRFQAATPPLTPPPPPTQKNLRRFVRE